METAHKHIFLEEMKAKAGGGCQTGTVKLKCGFTGPSHTHGNANGRSEGQIATPFGFVMPDCLMKRQA
jgi:hypothetical protein